LSFYKKKAPKTVPPKIKKMATCSNCSLPLPNDGRIRVRNRKRKCKTCKLAQALKKRRSNTVKLLHHRFYNAAIQRWPEIDPSVLSMATVRAVADACQHQSVISGEKDPEQLVIVSKLDQVPTHANDLAIVTRAEARMLKRQTPQQREMNFTLL
jgi:hypothetical protein